MKNLKVLKISMSVLILIPGLLLIPGCAAKKPLAESPESGIVLRYKMPAGPGIQYKSTGTMKQNMEIQGQSIQADIATLLNFSLKPKTQAGENLLFGITIDSMAMSVISPMAQFSADLREVLGKSFDMTLSGLGKEVDLSGAEAIQYTIPQAGKRNIALNFQDFFPDLPEQKVKIGDTWNKTDTVVEKTNAEEVETILASENTLTGTENVKGYDCVVIVSKIKGPRTGSQDTQGMTLNTKGDVTGEMTWYFAYREGLFVKASMNSVIKSTITVTGGQNFSFPLDMEVISEIEMFR